MLEKSGLVSERLLVPRDLKRNGPRLDLFLDGAPLALVHVDRLDELLDIIPDPC